MNPQITEGINVGKDQLSWSTSLSRIGAILTAGTNEFVRTIQVVFGDVPIENAVEKCGLFVEGWVRSKTRHYPVAAVFINTIETGNMNGQAWAGYDEAGCDVGADGFTCGWEAGGNNNGVDQPEIGQANSKLLRKYVAGENPGNRPMTAIGSIEAGTSSFHQGWVADAAAFTLPQSEVWSVRQGSSTLGALHADGTLTLRLFLDGSHLGNMAPGTLAMVGYPATGETALVYFNGGSYLQIRLQ